MTADERAAFERERPENFLRHATVATSQYDAQYRSMASEILLLRVESARCRATLAEIEECAGAWQYDAATAARETLQDLSKC